MGEVWFRRVNLAQHSSYAGQTNSQGRGLPQRNNTATSKKIHEPSWWSLSSRQRPNTLSVKDNLLPFVLSRKPITEMMKKLRWWLLRIWVSTSTHPTRSQAAVSSEVAVARAIITPNLKNSPLRMSQQGYRLKSSAAFTRCIYWNQWTQSNHSHGNSLNGSQQG